MIFLTLLLLNSGLIFIAAMPLNYYVTPIHYNIKLIPYPEENIFYGECNINIHIFHEIKTINLYLEELCIIEVELSTNMQKLEFNDADIVNYKPEYFYDIETYIVHLNFTDKLSSGNYTLNIKYTGSTADNGGFKIYNVKDGEYNTWVAATHFQTIGARRLFPCFDTLQEATFNISMLHYRQYMIFSNMPVRRIEMLFEDDMLTHFDTTPVMSTHFIAVVISQIVSIHNQHYGTILMWCRDLLKPYVSLAYNVAKTVTLYLRNEWKHSKNISKVKHIVIPDFEDKNLINLGLVLYREADVIYNEMVDSVVRKIEIIRLVGHKVAQEYFCNIVNPLWSPTPLLNKALGKFIGIYAANKFFSNYRIMDLFIVQFQHDLLRLDTDYYMPFLLQNNELFERLQYIRAFFILRMLQHAISEEIFWKGIHFYAYETNQHVATLLSSMSRAVLVAQADEKQEFKSNLSSINTIDTAIGSWQKHYPIIKIVRNYDDPENLTEVTVEVQNFNTSKFFCIPITFTTQKYLNFNDTLPRYWLNISTPNISLNLDFKEDGWMIFNTQQTGYYRVNYDVENWRRITDFLNSENYIKIHVLNRAQFIDDAFNLMIMNQLNSSIFWNLTNYLSRETDYVAWYPMFKTLEYMSSVFPLPREEVDIIKVRMLRILKKLYRKKDILKNDLETCLKQEVAKWACFFDDPLCKKDAGKITDNLFIVDPLKKFRLIPQWDKWTYCRGLANVNSTWWDVYNYYTEVPRNKYLKFIACSENSDNIKLFLNLMENVTSTDYTSKILIIESFLFAIAKHAKNDDVLEHILENFAKLKIRYVNSIVALTVIINHVYTEHQLNMISSFLYIMFHKAIKLDEFKSKNISYAANKGDDILIEIKKHYLLIKHKITKRLPELQIQIDYLKSFAPSRDEELEKSVIEEEEILEKEEKKIKVPTTFIEGIIQHTKEREKEEKIDKIKEIIEGILKKEFGEK